MTTTAGAAGGSAPSPPGPPRTRTKTTISRRRTKSVIPASLRRRRRTATATTAPPPSERRRGRRRSSLSDGVVVPHDGDDVVGVGDGPPGAESASRRSTKRVSDAPPGGGGGGSGRGRSRGRSRSRSRGRRTKNKGGRNKKGGNNRSSSRSRPRPLGPSERRRLALVARATRRRADSSSSQSQSPTTTMSPSPGRGREEEDDDNEDGPVEMDDDEEEAEEGEPPPSPVLPRTPPPSVRRRRRRVARVVPASLRRRTRRSPAKAAVSVTKTAGAGAAATTKKGTNESGKVKARVTTSMARVRASSTGPPSVRVGGSGPHPTTTPAPGGAVTPDAPVHSPPPRRSRRRWLRGEISKLCDSWLGPEAEDVLREAYTSFEDGGGASRDRRPAHAPGAKVVTPSPGGAWSPSKASSGNGGKVGVVDGTGGGRRGGVRRTRGGDLSRVVTPHHRGIRKSQRMMTDEVSRLCDSWLGPTAEDLGGAFDAEADADHVEGDHEGGIVDEEEEGEVPGRSSSRRSRYVAREVRKMREEAAAAVACVESPTAGDVDDEDEDEDEEMTAWDGGGDHRGRGKKNPSSSSEVIVVEEDDAITAGLDGDGNGRELSGEGEEEEEASRKCPAPSAPSAAAASATAPRVIGDHHRNSSRERRSREEAGGAGAVGLPLEELVALERRMEGRRADLGLLADEQAEVVQRMTQLQAELGPLTRALMDRVSAAANSSAAGGGGTATAAMPSVTRSYERHIGWTRGELNTLAREQIDIVNRMSAIKEDLNAMQKEMYELVTLERGSLSGSGSGVRSQHERTGGTFDPGSHAAVRDAGHDDGAAKSEEPPQRGANSSRAKLSAISQGNGSTDKKRGAVLSTTTDDADLQASTIMSGSSTVVSCRHIKQEKNIGNEVDAHESGMRDRGRDGEKNGEGENEPVENVDSLQIVATHSRRATLRSHARCREDKSNHTKKVLTTDPGKNCVSPTSDGEDELHGKVMSGGDDALSSIASPRAGTVSKKVTGGERKRKRPSRACTKRKIFPCVTAEAASTSTTRPYKKRRRPFRRCGTCVACLSDFCGTCKGCLDMRRFGGSKRWNTGCIRRKCLSPLPPRGDAASSTVRSESVSLRRRSRPRDEPVSPLVSVEDSDTTSLQRHDRSRPTDAFHPSHVGPSNVEPSHVDSDVKSLSDGLVGEDISDFDDVEVERKINKKSESDDQKAAADGGGLSSLRQQNVGETPMDKEIVADTGSLSNLPQPKLSTGIGGASTSQEVNTDRGSVAEPERHDENTKESLMESTLGEKLTPQADAAGAESLSSLPQPKLITGSRGASPTRNVSTRHPSAAELAREFRELQRNFRQVDPYTLSDEDDYCYLLPPPLV